MAGPGGLWLSFINKSPLGFPNDGVVAINEPVNNKFTGDHLRQGVGKFETTPIEGTYIPGGAGTPDHITFTEDVGGVIHTYEADFIELTPGFFLTTKGKRKPGATAADDDWVGTHTT